MSPYEPEKRTNSSYASLKVSDLQARRQQMAPISNILADAVKIALCILSVGLASLTLYGSPLLAGLDLCLGIAAAYILGLRRSRFRAVVRGLDRLACLLIIATFLPMIIVCGAVAVSWRPIRQRLQIRRVVGLHGETVRLLAFDLPCVPASKAGSRLAGHIAKVLMCLNGATGAMGLFGREPLTVEQFLSRGPFYLDELNMGVGLLRRPYAWEAPPRTIHIHSEFAQILDGSSAPDPDALLLLLRVNVMGAGETPASVVSPYIVEDQFESHFRADITDSRVWTDGDAIAGRFRHATALLNAAWKAWSTSPATPLSVGSLESAYH